MQPLDPDRCSTASVDPSMPDGARDHPAESIHTTLKHPPNTTQAAMLGRATCDP
ncbi:MAG: hypothetical protein ACRC8Y_13635 [Chroococcales cyanobacterium]